MKREVVALFNQAESYRTEESKKLEAKELCDKMAYEAGWHTVYTPSNRSKVKDKVAYERSFNSILFSELLCRYKKPIIKAFGATGALDLEKTEEKIYDVILRFMGTYNPEKTVCNSQITTRMSLSIRQRAIECNYESHTLYSYDSTKINVKDESGRIVGIKYLSMDNKIHFKSTSEYSDKEVEEISKEMKTPNPDWRCCKEVSMNSTIKIGKNQDEKALEDYIQAEDDFEKAEFRQDYETELSDLENKYASTDSQKTLLRILVDLGEKTSPAKLLKIYIEETGKEELQAKKEVYKFYKTLKARLLANA